MYRLPKVVLFDGVRGFKALQAGQGNISDSNARFGNDADANFGYIESN